MQHIPQICHFHQSVVRAISNFSSVYDNRPRNDDNVQKCQTNATKWKPQNATTNVDDWKLPRKNEQQKNVKREADGKIPEFFGCGRDERERENSLRLNQMWSGKKRDGWSWKYERKMTFSFGRRRRRRRRTEILGRGTRNITTFLVIIYNRWCTNRITLWCPLLNSTTMPHNLSLFVVWGNDKTLIYYHSTHTHTQAYYPVLLLKPCRERRRILFLQIMSTKPKWNGKRQQIIKTNLRWNGFSTETTCET